MNNTINQQIKDSEENIVNKTYWHIQPFYQMIQKDDTARLMESLDIEIEKMDFHERVGKDRRKENEYMTVSLINTFMIAAITGGVYPPDANWIADQSLQRLAEIKDDAEMTGIITDAAYQFSEKVRAIKAADTGNPHVEKARQYILTHLTQPIVLDDIVEEIGITRYHLCRIFKECTGKTIIQYLTDERIEAAKDLLLNNDYTISEIASLLQFCDQSYFVATFRKKTGMTPGKYRRQNVYAAKH